MPLCARVQSTRYHRRRRRAHFTNGSGAGVSGSALGSVAISRVSGSSTERMSSCRSSPRRGSGVMWPTSRDRAVRRRRISPMISGSRRTRTSAEWSMRTSMTGRSRARCRCSSRNWSHCAVGRRRWSRKSEACVARRCSARGTRPKMMFPLVRYLAAGGCPVTVPLRVLSFSTSASSRWVAIPVSRRDWDNAQLMNAIIDVRRDDPEFGYRVIADKVHRLGRTASYKPVPRLCALQEVASSTVKWRRGSGTQPGPAVSADLSQRNFTTVGLMRFG